LLFEAKISTPLGDMIAHSTDSGICNIEFFDTEASHQNRKSLELNFNTKILFEENKILSQLKIELAEYFLMQRKIFSLSLDLIGTEFQKQVWAELLKIPFGKTISYLDQAKLLGNAKSIRAVANANGKNKIGILIPCHRVIGSNGSLTGYAGGLHRKKWLLDFESDEKKLF
jgi:O-6-methylguanine DNA methyltransferase